MCTDVLIQIGQSARIPHDLDALGLLRACHARIRNFDELAARLARASAPSEQIADAAARVHTYFTIALPLHARDEEESLLPRLERAGVGEAVVRALREMVAQHDELDDAIEAMAPCWRAIAVEPAARELHAGTLIAESTRMSRLWAVHLPLEEEIIFPAMERLSSEARDVIAAEIRARRTG